MKCTPNWRDYTYDSWGKLISTTGTLASTVGLKNPYRYRGYRYDTETGLYYLQSRYYNPDWGRFVNADGLVGKTGELLSHNMFAYALNNPVNRSDPNGKDSIYTGMWDTFKKSVKLLWQYFRSPEVQSDIAEYTFAYSVGGPLGVGMVEGRAAANSLKGPIIVTEGLIRQSMKGAPLRTQQKRVSQPVIQRYVDRLQSGDKAPPIRVDNGVIVDGNHRYIAGRIVGQEPPQTSWPGGRPDNVIEWDHLKIDPSDWGNK